jgi:hypothetical protein
VAEEDDGLFGANVERSYRGAYLYSYFIFQCLVFHLLSVYLFYLFYCFAPFFFLYVYTTYLSAYSHVNCILFAATLK